MISCSLKCDGIILTGGVEKPTPALSVMMMVVMMMMMIRWVDAQAANMTAERAQLRDEWYSSRYRRQYLRPDERYYFNQVRHSRLLCTIDNWSPHAVSWCTSQLHLYHGSPLCTGLSSRCPCWYRNGLACMVWHYDMIGFNVPLDTLVISGTILRVTCTVS